MESFRKHRFTLGNMAVDNKLKCLSLLSRTSVVLNGVFVICQQIVSEDLDYWFLRQNQLNFLFVSSAPDALRKQNAEWIYTFL